MKKHDVELTQERIEALHDALESNWTELRVNGVAAGDIVKVIRDYGGYLSQTGIGTLLSRLKEIKRQADRLIPVLEEEIGRRVQAALFEDDDE